MKGRQHGGPFDQQTGECTMSFSERVVQLKITSTTMIDGVMVKVGQLVEMVESEAKNLMRLGKAELHKVMSEVEGKLEDAPELEETSETAQAAAQAAADATTTTPPPNVLSSSSRRTKGA